MVSLKPRNREMAASTSGRALLWVFGTWSFLASALIFWVELMVAKMLLPPFGGAASVWNTALVFFQISLLAGYAAAHFLSRFDSKRHKLIQAALVVLPALTLPVALPEMIATQSVAPVVAVLFALTLMVGAPFFALSTSTPTLQAWFSHSDHPQASDPYFLYALSNVGSVVGLFGYPLLIERLFTIREQALLWGVGYLVFAVVTLFAARLVVSWPAPERKTVMAPPIRRRLGWAAVAFVPSLGLLGVTLHLSTDVAAFPLMWTIPLAIYLASFVATFRRGGDAWTKWGFRAVRILVVPAALVGFFSNILWLNVGLPLALLAAVALAGHGRVYQDRPESSSLTHFYLWVSIGGAAGGLFASLIAPAVFDFVIEYPLAIVLAAIIAGPALRGRSPDRRLLLLVVFAGVIAGTVSTDQQIKLACFAISGLVAVIWLNREILAGVMAAVLIAIGLSSSGDVVASERTFFGVYRIHEASGFNFIMSGSTLHGMQLIDESERQIPVSYYHEDGPVGDVFRALDDNPRSVGIIGLGIGALTPYGQIADEFVYYEIDAVVEDLARDVRHFTLLSDAAPEVAVVIGDGRIELERLQPKHDLLVIDAFASDSIPIHLLTHEAFLSYKESLTPDGIILVHISNRHLDLEPVVGRIAEELDMSARVNRYEPEEGVEWAVKSIWVVVEGVAQLPLGEDWEPARLGDSLWTDDYSNLISVLIWD